MPVCYLAFGSNQGNREENIERALHRLCETGVRITRRSSIIETDPVGGPPQEKYLNGVVRVETELSPRALLSLLQSIEKELGRTAGVRNAPRPIDLDILLYDDIRMTSPELTVPHPRMWERAFVLSPLKEIFPDLKYPLSPDKDS